MDIQSVSSVLELQKQVASSNVETAHDKKFNEILNKAMETQDNSELKDACDQLEAYMLSMMFKQMKSSMLSGDTLMGKGDYEKMFEDTYVNSLCEEMVKAGGVGLSDAMYRQITNQYANQMQIGSLEAQEAVATSAIKVDVEA